MFGALGSWAPQNFAPRCVKEESQTNCVFELQSFFCEGEKFFEFPRFILYFWRKNRKKLRFWVSKLHFCRKSRWKASLLSFQASFLQFQSHWISNWMTCQSLESQSEWFSNQLNLKATESEVRVWNHLNLTSPESQVAWTLEFKINDRQSNHLKLESIDNQIAWLSNHWTTKSPECQTAWISNQLTFKAVESQICWIPNAWTDNKSTWTSNQMTCKTIESEISWLSNQLNSTASSYRVLIFGNFRHRLVR